MSTILCESCGLAFSRKDSLARHQSTCKGNALIEKLRKEILDLKAENKKLKQQVGTVHRNSTTANQPVTHSGNINTATTINNVNNNITIVLNFSKPNISYFPKEVHDLVMRLKGKSQHYVFLELFDFIYKNPKYPENHSIKFEDGEIKIMENGWEISSAGEVVTVSLDKIKEGLQELDETYQDDSGSMFNDKFGIRDTDTVDCLGLLCADTELHGKLPQFLRKHLEHAYKK